MQNGKVILGQLKTILAFTRIPGNALSFWIRQTLHWSRGRPTLYQEPKEDVFRYLGTGKKTAENQAVVLNQTFHLQKLAGLSTAALYRKNLYLIQTLEKATEGLDLPESHNELRPHSRRLKAMDVGAQDWHYVFGLERWLRYKGCPQGREVSLLGLELDGYGIYSDFHSRKDYAEAYVEQTENPEVHYAIGDFLKGQASNLQGQGKCEFDLLSIFYPFVTRYQLLLWGLPLRFFSPAKFLDRSANLLKPGGWLLVFCHTQREHDVFMQLGNQNSDFELLRQGPVQGYLVDFYAEIQDRHFSIWKRTSVSK